jgi:hypothetical protein
LYGEEKDMLRTMPLEHISTIPQLVLKIIRKRFMITAIDTYFNSSYKNGVIFFKEENIGC